MTIRCLPLFLLTASLGAQIPGPLPPGFVGPPVAAFPAAIRLFLDLSDSQVQTIQQQNADLGRFAAGKSLRASQVQQEIAQETARPGLDPLALGLRYTELEVIRRELQDEFRRTRDRIRRALTEPQRAKLRSLEDIFKLLPIYSEAANVNLVENPGDFAPLPGFIFSPGNIPVSRMFPQETPPAEQP